MQADASTELRSLIAFAAAPFALGAAVCAACYASAGQTLGFYLGPTIAAALILPPIVAPERRPLRLVLAWGAIVDGIGVGWLLAVFGPHLTLGQWLACYLTLAAFALALCGVTLALTRAIGPLAGAACTTVVAIAWLTWPVWLSPWLAGQTGATLSASLSTAHPLLAINRALIDLGIWTQLPLIYRHTVLGQDVPFALPRSIGPAVLLHAITGAALLWAAGWARPAARQRAATSPAAAEA